MRLVARLPTHPIVSALMITAAVVTTYALVEWLGGSPAGERGFAGLTYNQIGFSIAALAGGYALAAGYLINAENAATLEELGPLLRAAKPARILEDVSLSASRGWGLGGALAGLAFSYSVDKAVFELLTLRAFSTDALSSVILLPLVFWISLRAAYFTVAGMRAVSRAVERNLSVDPLESDRLAPLGRMAMRAGLLWVGAAAVASLSVWLTMGSVAEFFPIAFLLAVAVGSFVIPVRRVHFALRTAKDSELRWVRTEILRDRDAVRAGDRDVSRAAQRLPGLLAYEARVASAREWPFDASTLVRFALYLSIPLFSWLGGALVERLVDQLLD
jgi:hypothetical protein